MAALCRRVRLTAGVEMPLVGLGTCTCAPGGQVCVHTARYAPRLTQRGGGGAGNAGKDEVAQAVRAALEAGYRHIDGAAVCTSCRARALCVRVPPSPLT
jgi:diketogulonate reductase-like aldo/keto reductase